MKNHIFRPLWVAIGAVFILLMVRAVVVPSDFGINGRNFTYGFHRLGSIADWKNFKVKYQGKEYCRKCHEDKVTANLASPHRNIQCENCHGPALAHPDDPALLAIDRGRELCLRCHAHLDYPGNPRLTIKRSIEAGEHNPGQECCICHNPHHPNLEEMQ